MSKKLARDTGDTLWVGVVSVASVLFSWALACATPFAAIATIAGTRMNIRGAMALTGVAWLANQLVGYLVLGYPTTWDSFAWGAAIGVASLVAVLCVTAIRRTFVADFASLGLGFVTAFLAYELVLLAATAILPSGDEAFSLSVVVDIFWTNVVALAGLLAMHGLAVAADLLVAKPSGHTVGHA